MKHKGSVCYYAEERNEFFYRTYKRLIRETKQITMLVDNKPSELMKQIALAPAPRYWVSESRASAVISLLEKGIPLPDTMIPHRRRLFLHLFEKYKEERAKYPTKSTMTIMLEIVLSPAPESFISPSSIPRYIIDYREKIVAERKKKIQENEQKRKDTITLVERTADYNTHRNTTSVGIDDGNEINISLVESFHISVSPRQLDTPLDKPLQPIKPSVHSGRETQKTYRSRTDFSLPSRRIDRRHTNHRYVRNQLRLVWDDFDE